MPARTQGNGAKQRAKLSTKMGNKKGLITEPCRTPAQIAKGRKETLAKNHRF